MSSIVRKQDLPPPGGYTPLDFKRIPPKKIFSVPLGLALSFGCTIVGTYLYRINYRNVMMEEVEMRSSMIALQPLLYAERDRAYLKQVRANRDAENELMKDVKNWTTGHYYNEPLYKTVPEDTFLPIPYYEFYIHNSKKDQNDQLFEFSRH